MLFYVGLDVLKLAIRLGGAIGCVESCGVGGRHGGLSVVLGRRLIVGDVIQRL